MERNRIRWRTVARIAAALAAGVVVVAIVPGLLEPGDPPPLPRDIGLASGPMGAQALTPDSGAGGRSGEQGHRASGGRVDPPAGGGGHRAPSSTAARGHRPVRPGPRKPVMRPPATQDAVPPVPDPPPPSPPEPPPAPPPPDRAPPPPDPTPPAAPPPAPAPPDPAPLPAPVPTPDPPAPQSDPAVVEQEFGFEP